jgi:hypothetical protein
MDDRRLLRRKMVRSGYWRGSAAGNALDAASHAVGKSIKVMTFVKWTEPTAGKQVSPGGGPLEPCRACGGRLTRPASWNCGMGANRLGCPALALAAFLMVGSGHYAGSQPGQLRRRHGGPVRFSARPEALPRQPRSSNDGHLRRRVVRRGADRALCKHPPPRSAE